LSFFDWKARPNRALGLILLSLYFFLLALYGKRFAYLGFKLGPLPLFVSELVLLGVLAARFFDFPRLRHVSGLFLASVVFFLSWGFLRLGLSFAEGRITEFGLVESLQQTAIFYLAVWVLVPFLFSLRELKALVSVALLGIGAAQALGWLSFLLMGGHNGSLRYMGMPAGNEALLPLFPLAFLLWSPRWAWIYCLCFGNLWVSQFLLYMKRTFVFSALVIQLPVLLLAPAKFSARARGLGWGTSLVAGSALALLGLWLVQERGEPPFFPITAKEKAAAQRSELPVAGRIALTALEGVFPDSRYGGPSGGGMGQPLEKIVFKGDLKKGEDGRVESFMAFRKHLWGQAWSGFLERPWIGQGFGTRMLETQLNGLPAKVEGRWISGPHNSFLSILNRLGILGALAFCAMAGSVLWGLHRRLRALPTFGWVALAGVASTNFFALFNVCLENPQGGVWYWFFLGLLAKVLWSEKEWPQLK
jgi:hypothetical protein